MRTDERAGDIDACVFDVFGTLVDWRTGIIEELAAVGVRTGVSADWSAIADAWRRLYRPTLDRVRRGELAWQNFDALHRLMLDQVLAGYGLDDRIGEKERDELVAAWHRLPAWPDSAPGLARLRKRHVVATLSNGHLAMLVRLAKSAGLPFDCILSVELARTYKPDPEVYRSASRLLDVPPEKLLMVACHGYDLDAAAEQGLRTAYVSRPLEWGPATESTQLQPPTDAADYVATDVEDLAAQLGC